MSKELTDWKRENKIRSNSITCSEKTKSFDDYLSSYVLKALVPKPQNNLFVELWLKKKKKIH